MSPHSLLTLILLITVVSYAFDQFLDYINLKAQRKDIPGDIALFYDRDKYNRSLDYHRDRTRLGFLSSACHILISISILLLAGLGLVDVLLSAYIWNNMSLVLPFSAI